MNQSETAKLAIALMKEHGVTKKGYRFEFDNATTRFGCCNHTLKIISLSKLRVYMHDDDEIKDTILHEIAHAVVGPGFGHGEVWQQIAIRIGATPKACYSDNRLPITGNTFPVKDALDRLGAKWDKRAWIIEPELLPFANFIVESARDGKVIISIQDKVIDADFTKPIFCRCESEVPVEKRTRWEYRGERIFIHKCGKTFLVL